MQATMRAGVLKSLCECTKDSWSSAVFVFSENGMLMRAMDSSHVALTLLSLTPAALSPFLCPQRTALGIQFDALSMVLKTCATEDQIKIASALDSDRITITRGDDLRQWELKLLEIEEDTMDIPQQTYDVSADIPSSGFQKACRDLKEIGGETITICVADGTTISCSVEGDHGRGTAVLNGVSFEQASEVGEKLICSYGLRFVASFAKGSPLCSTVRIQMGKETPLCLTYNIGEGLGCLQFFLASRIEED